MKEIHGIDPQPNGLSSKFALFHQIPYNVGVKTNIRIPLAVLALTSVAHAAQIVDTFDTGSNGWTAVEVAAGVSWSSTGGNPGGHIVIADDRTNWAYFRAPGAYLSSPAMYGGLLQFDLRHTLRQHRQVIAFGWHCKEPG